MNYLLDSDIVINFTRGDEGVIEIVRYLAIEGLLSISVITWFEVYYGAKKYKDAKNETEKFENFLRDFGIEVVDLSTEVARQAIDAKLDLESQGVRIEDFDLLIAGTAVAHDLVLVTGNRGHFERVEGVEVWEG